LQEHILRDAEELVVLAPQVRRFPCKEVKRNRLDVDESQDRAARPLPEWIARESPLGDHRSVFRPGARRVEEGDALEGDRHIPDPELPEIEDVLEKQEVDLGLHLSSPHAPESLMRVLGEYVRMAKQAEAEWACHAAPQ
jgi:hypothetical protein